MAVVGLVWRETQIGHHQENKASPPVLKIGLAATAIASVGIAFAKRSENGLMGRALRYLPTAVVPVVGAILSFILDKVWPKSNGPVGVELYEGFPATEKDIALSEADILPLLDGEKPQKGLIEYKRGKKTHYIALSATQSNDCKVTVIFVKNPEPGTNEWLPYLAWKPRQGSKAHIITKMTHPDQLMGIETAQFFLHRIKGIQTSSNSQDISILTQREVGYLARTGYYLGMANCLGGFE